MKNPRSRCPVALTLDVLGDTWTLLILRDLLLAGKRYYNDFLHSEEKISTNILADRLARLERYGIIAKAEDPANKKRFIYSPTPKGLDLLPTLFELARWGLKYDSRANRDSLTAQQFRSDEQKLRQEIFSRFADKGE